FAMPVACRAVLRLAPPAAPRCCRRPLRVAAPAVPAVMHSPASATPTAIIRAGLDSKVERISKLPTFRGKSDRRDPYAVLCTAYLRVSPDAGIVPTVP